MKSIKIDEFYVEFYDDFDLITIKKDCWDWTEIDIDFKTLEKIYKKVIELKKDEEKN